MSQFLLAARLASRGVRAYRRRSLQTLLVVGFGVALVVLTDSFMQGFSAKIMDQMLSATGHLSLTAPGYAAQREVAPIDLFIPDVEVLKGRIRKDAVAAAPDGSLVLSASIFSAGLVSDGERSVTTTCRGIDPFWQGTIVPALRDVARRVEGSFFVPGGAPGLLVSRRVADKLNARPGDRLMFLCSDRYGSFGVVELVLLGIFPKGAAMGGEECLMDLAPMQSVTGLEGGASEVSVWRLQERAGGWVLANPRERSPVIEEAARIAQADGCVAQRWSEISASYGSMMSFFDLYMAIMCVIFAVVAAMGMTNSILLSVQDRIRDIGTLRVVALSRGGVSLMVALESFILGLCGAAAGALIGGAASFLLEHLGFTLQVELEAIASYMQNGMRPRFSPGRAAIIGLVASCVPLLASLLPIATLRRITVREALGYV
jgi:putative ABC transport system permease protein